MLLPLLPVTLLALEEPLLTSWLPAAATFSIFPLLKKDGLSLAYAAMLLLWASISNLSSCQDSQVGSRLFNHAEHPSQAASSGNFWAAGCQEAFIGNVEELCHDWRHSRWMCIAYRSCCV